MVKSAKIAMMALILSGSFMTACSPPAKTKHETKLYHFKDGRVGYEDRNGVWWYVASALADADIDIPDGPDRSSRSSTSSSSSARIGSSFGLQGSYRNSTFAPGREPTKEEEAEAQEEQVQTDETEATEGTEADASEGAEATEGGDQAGADISSDAGSGDTGGGDAGGGDAGGGGDGGGGGGE
jgi:hypothetical protein